MPRWIGAISSSPVRFRSTNASKTRPFLLTRTMSSGLTEASCMSPPSSGTWAPVARTAGAVRCSGPESVPRDVRLHLRQPHGLEVDVALGRQAADPYPRDLGQPLVAELVAVRAERRDAVAGQHRPVEAVVFGGRAEVVGPPRAGLEQLHPAERVGFVRDLAVAG